MGLEGSFVLIFFVEPELVLLLFWTEHIKAQGAGLVCEAAVAWRSHSVSSLPKSMQITVICAFCITQVIPQ